MSVFEIHQNRTKLFNLTVDTSLSSLSGYTAKILVKMDNDLVINKDLSINGFVLSGNLTYTDTSIKTGNGLGEIIIDNSINKFNVKTDLGGIFSVTVVPTLK